MCSKPVYMILRFIKVSVHDCSNSCINLLTVENMYYTISVERSTVILYLNFFQSLEFFIFFKVLHLFELSTKQTTFPEANTMITSSLMLNERKSHEFNPVHP